MDYFMTSFMITTIDKIHTGYFLYDILISFFLITGINFMIKESNRNNILCKISNLIDWNNKYNSITYSSTEKDVSIRYRALMWLISKNDDPSVRKVSEVELKKYNNQTDNTEYHTSFYRVSQSHKFNITTIKGKKIIGRVFWYSKDKSETFGKISYVDYQNLELISQLSIKEIINWVDSIEKDYKQYLKLKMLDTQTMVEVSWNSHEQKMEAFYINWKSNVTFDNRFFTEKKEIVDKINFFINNEEWYKEKGIPYTLGILLWGDPGCGKTSFIKALMNLTKRHAVNIKLSKKMNMNCLREIIYDDEITEEIIIPQDKRIILFEDIDAMCEIVMDRDIPKNNSEVDLEKKISDAIDSTMRQKKRNNDNFSLVSKIDNNDNNNLSFFLNILDGINECPGRIIIMTSNKPEMLDPALIRPGRIDFKIHMKKATTSDIKEIIKFYWNINEEIELNQEWSEKLTHAEIISFCRLTNNHYDTILYIEKFIMDNEKNNKKNKSINIDIDENNTENNNKKEKSINIDIDENNTEKSIDIDKKELKHINELLYNQPFY